LSPVEFKSVEWWRSKPVVATHENEEQILKIGVRELKRATSVSHPTINMIRKGERGHFQWPFWGLSVQAFQIALALWQSRWLKQPNRAKGNER
jgi:hypothetical protein